MYTLPAQSRRGGLDESVGSPSGMRLIEEIEPIGLRREARCGDRTGPTLIDHWTRRATDISSNSNADTVVQYKLKQPVIARYLRLIPLDWNPTGRTGLRLEIYGCRYTSDVAGFDGSSSLVYRHGARPGWTPMETVSLKFKTLKNCGTLLHAEGSRGHSLTLELEKGRLLLYQQQGIHTILPMFRYHKAHETD
ncbi:Contactin-associated protein-like 5 [Liparis tanakae]|uniref:Contactin-associated protein-like 5 n=1 Tax=Liparis tanakae TaxID=230148 RepID=A0A4Z2GRK2_9TELE|nr:Contactin-associated protein-like 5 [Liparis tanakae]